MIPQSLSKRKELGFHWPQNPTVRICQSLLVLLFLLFSLFPRLPSFHLLNFEFLLCRNEMALYSQPHPKLGMMKSFSPSCTNLFIRSEHFSFPRFCRLLSFQDSDLNTSYAMPCRTWARATGRAVVRPHLYCFSTRRSFTPGGLKVSKDGISQICHGLVS